VSADALDQYVRGNLDRSIERLTLFETGTRWMAHALDEWR